MISREEFGQAYIKESFKTRTVLRRLGVWYEYLEDVNQEAWARGWERREQLHDGHRIGPWIITIGLNVYRTILRSPQYRRTVALIAEDNFLDPVDLQDEVTRHVYVEQLLSRSSLIYKQVLILYYFSEMSIKEIGKIEQLETEAIKSRLMRGREELVLGRKRPPETVRRKQARQNLP